MIPPIQILGPDAILLAGPAIPAARTAVTIARRVRRRNGLPESPTLTDLEHHLATMSAPGHSDIGNDTTEQAEPIEWLSTEQVAELLQCSTRHVRRRGTELGGQQLNGRWQFDASTITEQLEGTHH